MKSPISRNEFDQIHEIQDVLGAAHPRVRCGIGDDAAILTPPTNPMLFCSDALVENVHFRLEWITARQLGLRSMMTCASDLAAMNGQWLYSTVSIALPAHLQKGDFLQEFYQGVRDALRRFGADVVGGDLTSSPGPLFIDVACIGSSSQPVQRKGAVPGDLIMVSGKLGSSRAGFEILKSGRADLRDRYKEMMASHLEPEARFDLIEKIRSQKNLISSMIDISDGLSSELHHLAANSKLSLQVDEKALPFDTKLGEVASALGIPDSAREWILHGGEDYQLLATMNAERVAEIRQNAPTSLNGWTCIGIVLDGEGVLIQGENEKAEPLAKKGFHHF